MQRFVISDTHFGHASCIYKFKKYDDVPLRSFSSVDEMNDFIIDNWNKTVSNNDTVYHLGDVVINRKYLNILSRLNGRKILIKGNHDLFKLKDYLPYFEDIRAFHKSGNMMFSHFPIHSGSIPEGRFNIHGHTHWNNVQLNNKDDKRYINVSVERTGYKPINVNDLLEIDKWMIKE